MRDLYKGDQSPCNGVARYIKVKIVRNGNKSYYAEYSSNNIFKSSIIVEMMQRSIHWLIL